jgi:hypothetical protein
MRTDLPVPDSPETRLKLLRGIPSGRERSMALIPVLKNPICSIPSAAAIHLTFILSEVGNPVNKPFFGRGGLLCASILFEHLLIYPCNEWDIAKSYYMQARSVYYVCITCFVRRDGAY